MRNLKRFSVKLSLESDTPEEDKAAKDAAEKAEKEAKEAAEAEGKAKDATAEAETQAGEATAAEAEASTAAAEATDGVPPEAEGTPAEATPEATPEAAPEVPAEAAPEAGAEVAAEPMPEVPAETGAEATAEVPPEAAAAEVPVEGTTDAAPAEGMAPMDAGTGVDGVAMSTGTDTDGVPPEMGASAVGADGIPIAADAAAAAVGSEVTGDPLQGEVAPVTEVQQAIDEIKARVQEIGENASSIETDLIELEKTAAEGDVQMDVIDQRTDAVDQLEDFAEVIEGTIENGGMSQDTANIVNIATEGIYNSLHIPKPKRRMSPSMEQFGTHSSRIQNTRASLEALTINIEHIKKTLIEAWRRLREWAVKFYQQLFDVSAKYEQRATKLVALAQQASSSKSTPKDPAIKDNRIFSELAIGNAVPADLNTALVKLGELTSFTLGQGAETVEFASNLIKIAQGGNFTGLSKNLPLPALSVPNTTAEDAGEGLHTLVSPVQPGNFVVYQTGPSAPMQGEAAINAVGDLDAGVRDVEGGAQEGNIKTLMPDQAGAVASTVVSLVQAVRSYKPHQDKLNQLKKQLESVAQRIKPEGVPEEDIQAINIALRGLMRVLDQPALALSKRVLIVSKAAMDLVEESLKSAISANAATPAQTAKARLTAA